MKIARIFWAVAWMAACVVPAASDSAVRVQGVSAKQDGPRRLKQTVDRIGRIGAYVSLQARHLNEPKQLDRLMRELKNSHVDFIIPFMTKHASGTVHWDSSVAPPELIGDRTYLEKVLKSAKASGLKVHPAFGLMTEGGENGPNVLLERHPAWAFKYYGKPQGYIDPGSADARRYEIELITELISKYEVDGLSLDYTRCPNRVGYTQTGRDYFLKKHNVDLAELTGMNEAAELDTEGGKAAASRVKRAAQAHPVWPEWKAWRTEQINGFMEELAAAVRKVRPDLPISSYVWGARTYTGNYESCQDWQTWVRNGWLDFINPSGYRYTEEEFLEAVKSNREMIPADFPYYITLGVATSHGRLENAQEVIRQLEIAAEEGVDGIIFFRWHSLQPFLKEVTPYLKTWPAKPEPLPARVQRQEKTPLLEPNLL